MFKTLSNTMDLIGVSWRLLKANKTLLVLPLISGLATLLIIALSAGVMYTAGAFDTGPSGQPSFSVADYLFFAVTYFALSLTVIYFNAALVAGAYDVLEGGTPTLQSCLDAAYSQLPTIVGWAAFATTIGLIIDRIRSGGGVFAILSWILDAIWNYATYFVVPVLVIEGLSPFDALRRSTSLFQETWGKQLVSNFGFGIAYFVLALAAIIPTFVAFMVAPTLGIAAAILYAAPVLIGGTLVLFTIEGIFRTALYRYAMTGEITGGFNDRQMRGAYVRKDDRGRPF